MVIISSITVREEEMRRLIRGLIQFIPILLIMFGSDSCDETSRTDDAYLHSVDPMMTFIFLEAEDRVKDIEITTHPQLLDDMQKKRRFDLASDIFFYYTPQRTMFTKTNSPADFSNFRKRLESIVLSSDYELYVM